MDYHIISDEIDAAAFLSEANGLHDGYIVSVDYQHHGYTWGNPMYIDPEKTKLVLRVMVTSIYNTLIEMVFEFIKDFHIKDDEFGLLDSSITFSKDGYVTWCGDLTTEPDSLRDSNYVVSKVMKWRIVSP
ncbi:MAG: hypothetical protein IJM12_02405 [Bacteroidales bacterium]|nr:hypothetical protein [Bacteroidales bacterium]